MNDTMLYNIAAIVEIKLGKYKVVEPRHVITGEMLELVGAEAKPGKYSSKNHLMVSGLFMVSPEEDMNTLNSKVNDLIEKTKPATLDVIQEGLYHHGYEIHKVMRQEA